ncbi:MAG: SBBP repeat-containing protein [Ardenticatenaceae bacterium]|nr:SBBP repeat-containing protein [Ardenticatenaceae bacterium]
MKVRLFTLLSLIVVLLLAAGEALGSTHVRSTPPTTPGPAPDRTRVEAVSERATVMFIENAGQFAEGARFRVWGGGAGAVWLAEDALWLTVLEQPDAQMGRQGDRQPFSASLPVSVTASQASVNLKLSFVGANPQPRLVPFNRLDTHVSYFIGNDPGNWHPDVPVWGGVRYVELYPGIDLELSSAGGQWQPRLVARPGANLNAVRLRVEGADGLTLEDDRLRLITAVGTFFLPLLQAVVADGSPLPISGEWPEVRGNEITVPFAAEEPAALPQDNPADLIYSTFLGGSGWDWGHDITVGANGAAYVTGLTAATNFPTTLGAFQTMPDSLPDVFVTKLNTTGTGLLYSTFLSGSNGDLGLAIAGDASGAAYVTGFTVSSNFPTTPGAFQTALGAGNCGGSACPDAFVTKLNAAGTGLLYSTFLGGTNPDAGWGIAVDTSRGAYVSGGTNSADFSTTSGAFQTSYADSSDVFVTKLSAAGSGVAYSTFLGGSGSECLLSRCSIAVDTSGAAYVAGDTNSADFPTTPGAFQTTLGAGDCGGSACPDAFVTKLNAAGSGLVYSTLLGGSLDDAGYDIAVDANGAAYVTGWAGSLDFPTTPGAFQTTSGGNWDAFATKLNAAGSGLLYSTFLGGNGDEAGSGIAVDASGAAFLTGFTYSTSFPTTPGAFQTTYEGGRHAFVTKLKAAGSELLYSTLLGGSLEDGGNNIAIDASGSAYVVGFTRSFDFPTTPGAFQATWGKGDCGPQSCPDAFVTKLATASNPPPPTPTPTATPTPASYRVYLPLNQKNH